MATKRRYRILSLWFSLGLGISILAAGARAQGGFKAAAESPKAPTQVDMYCSGVVSDQAPPKDTYIISGEESRYRITFNQGDHIYINRGSEQGVRVGDLFEVVRAVKETVPTKWFEWQDTLSKAMGTTYADIGRLRVVHVDSKTSTTEADVLCDAMQRGDIVRPFAARPAPAFHDVKFDRYAAPSGKKTAMVVNTKNFGVISGLGRIVYVNLGSGQGVQIGNYFRVFRYQGTHSETLYQVRDMAYKVYGFGSAPVAYKWDNLPRQVLGEGIVLRTGANSSTVLLTTAHQEIFDGDYVELE
jgi:hypothetical protein